MTSINSEALKGNDGDRATRADANARVPFKAGAIPPPDWGLRGPNLNNLNTSLSTSSPARPADAAR